MKQTQGQNIPEVVSGMLGDGRKEQSQEGGQHWVLSATYLTDEGDTYLTFSLIFRVMRCKIPHGTLLCRYL